MTSSPGERGAVPDLLVEQLALGELPADEAKALRARLEAADDPRLAEIERSNAEILADYPAQRMVPAIERKLAAAQEEPARPALPWMWISVGAAAAAAALVWFMVPGTELQTLERGLDGEPVAQLELDPDPVRLKGDPRLVVQRRVSVGTAEALRDGAPVAAGDQLSLGYQSGGQPFGVIVSIDGAGQVTLHHPATADGSTALSKRPHTLGHSYELDDAPGFERFVFVTGAAEIDVSVVEAAARAVATGEDPREAPLALPDGLRQATVLLRKDAE